MSCNTSCILCGHQGLWDVQQHACRLADGFTRVLQYHRRHTDEPAVTWANSLPGEVWKLCSFHDRNAKVQQLHMQVTYARQSLLDTQEHQSLGWQVEVICRVPQCLCQVTGQALPAPCSSQQTRLTCATLVGPFSRYQPKPLPVRRCFGCPYRTA